MKNSLSLSRLRLFFECQVAESKRFNYQYETIIDAKVGNTWERKLYKNKKPLENQEVTFKFRREEGI